MKDTAGPCKQINPNIEKLYIGGRLPLQISRVCKECICKVTGLYKIL
jgi:hypothetical protein